MADQLDRIEHEPAGVLATVKADGQPHLVPVVFAISQARVVTAVDWKPKSGRKLQRVLNIGADPRVSLLVHAYSDDWTALWWVRVDGVATLHHGDSVWERAREALSSKYTQYREKPPDGTVIAISPHRVSSWDGSG